MSNAIRATLRHGDRDPITGKPFVDVAAGMLIDQDGRILLGSRPLDKAWPGWWELPGGKIESGETPLQALARELDEELGITVTQAMPWVVYVHEYPKTLVRLTFCRVYGWEGEPRGMEGQQLAWVDPWRPYPVRPLLPATVPPMQWARLAPRYLLTNIGHPDKLDAWLEGLRRALDAGGHTMVQFREPDWTDQTALYEVYRQVLAYCRQSGVLCLVNSMHPQAWWPEADGVQLRSTDAQTWLRRYDGDKATRGSLSALRAHHFPRLLGVSAHTAEELAAASQLGADFAVLGHVLSTPSHPDVPGLGWSRFQDLASQAGVPVYAIGGQSGDTLATAMAHGAHGIASLRQWLADI